MAGFEINAGSKIPEHGLEITGDDGGYFNIDLTSAGGLEISTTDGEESQDRDGYPYHDEGTVRFTKEQAPDVILALQAWLGSL